MRSISSAALIAALTIGVSACGGYSSPTEPSGAPTAPADVLTIDVVGIRGAQSFSPDPATVPAGQRVVWHNVDTTTHRVVLDDGQLDTGNIAPGAFSAPMTLRPPSGYHCSIHPSMVGRLNAGSAGQADSADPNSGATGGGPDNGGSNGVDGNYR